MVELDRKEAMDVLIVLSKVDGYLMRKSDDLMSPIYDEIDRVVNLLVDRLDDEH